MVAVPSFEAEGGATIILGDNIVVFNAGLIDEALCEAPAVKGAWLLAAVAACWGWFSVV